MLSLRITLEGGGITKTIQFSPQTTVFDACKIISDKFAEAVQGKRKSYSIFVLLFIKVNLYFAPKNSE